MRIKGGNGRRKLSMNSVNKIFDLQCFLSTLRQQLSRVEGSDLPDREKMAAIKHILAEIENVKFRIRQMETRVEDMEIVYVWAVSPAEEMTQGKAPHDFYTVLKEMQSGPVRVRPGDFQSGAMPFRREG